MSGQEYEFKHGTIYGYVRQYIESLPDLTGKVVVDIPCGDGRTSLAFQKQGATVKAFDLYPEFDQAPRFASVAELARAIVRNKLERS